jgi:hypothetical protein
MSRRQQLAQSEAYATVPSCYQNILRHRVLKRVFASEVGKKKEKKSLCPFFFCGKKKMEWGPLLRDAWGLFGKEA